MDTSLLALGALIVICLVIAAMWHAIVRSYLWAVVASGLSIGLVVYLVYPIYRGVAADPLILINSIIMGVMITLGVGLPFKRWRAKSVSGGK